MALPELVGAGAPELVPVELPEAAGAEVLEPEPEVAEEFEAPLAAEEAADEAPLAREDAADSALEALYRTA